MRGMWPQAQVRQNFLDDVGLVNSESVTKESNYGVEYEAYD